MSPAAAGGGRQLAGDSTARTVSDLFRLGPRRGDPPDAVSPSGETASAADAGRVFASTVLPKFLASLGHHDSPSLLDLGPVVGSNITFFGERLRCKIFVEDLFAEIERSARQNPAGDLAAFFAARFRGREHSVDGVLCWDVFDYLDWPAARVLASCLAGMVRPGGAVLGFFGTAKVDQGHYTKYVIADDAHLRHRPYPATDTRTRVLLNRDIIRLFEGLEVRESVLLQINTREILFRKI